MYSTENIHALFMSKLIHAQLTYLLNGLLFAVHNELGRFAREKQYANAFEKKLKANNIRYQRELAVGDTGNILDFLIENKIVIEFKSKAFLLKEDYFQIQRYLHILNLELGLLVNFRNPYLQPKRVLRRDAYP